MSRKAVLEPIYISSTEAKPLNSPTGVPLVQSLASSFNTVMTSVKMQDNLSYQIHIMTNDSTGSFQLQGSNDNVTYIDLALAGVVAAANDDSLININQFPFAFMRLAYTSTIAGTGTCNIILHGRSVGA